MTWIIEYANAHGLLVTQRVEASNLGLAFLEFCRLNRDVKAEQLNAIVRADD